MGVFDLLFGKRAKKIQYYLKKKALIIDVRTEREFKNGAIKGAKNIPLDTLRFHLDEIKQKNSFFIIYCASGIRSSKATKFLNLNNINAINGGGINSLKSYLK